MSDLDVLAGEVDVAPSRVRVVPLAALMIGVGMVFVTVVAGLVLVSTVGFSWIQGAVFSGTFGSAPPPSVEVVQAGSGVELPAGAVSQQPVDDSAYVIGQVRFPGDYSDTIVAAGYIELSDVPDRELSVWNGSLDNPRYFVTGDGRSALGGTVDGAYTVTFYAQP